MFTGLIEEVGSIKQIRTIPDGRELVVIVTKILDDLSVDDSVSINGICLTATKIYPDGFQTQAVGETLLKTTLKNIKANDPVNIERAVRPIDRLGGHLVQGHVNGVGSISHIVKRGENYYMQIKVPPVLEKYLINEGSIAVDGISLTIARLDENKVGLSVIPHTWNNTNLMFKKTGDQVNIEVDVIAKYVERLLSMGNSVQTKSHAFSEDWLRKLGYNK